MTAKFQDYLINDFDTEENGNKAVGVEITIYEAGTRTPAVLLDENDIEIANPVTTNADGYYEFYIAGGSYDFVTDVGTDKEKYIYVAEPILVRGASLTPLNNGVWADGQIFTTYDEYMIFGGTAYRPKASTSLPYTVGASPDLNFVEPITLSDHNLLTNRDDEGAHDQIYPRQLESVSDFSTANLPAGLKVGTKGYSGPDGIGAAEYITWTLADYRNEIGNGSWVPDELGEAFTLANGNVAVLLADEYIEITKFGAKYGKSQPVYYDEAISFALLYGANRNATIVFNGMVRANQNHLMYQRSKVIGKSDSGIYWPDLTTGIGLEFSQTHTGTVLRDIVLEAEDSTAFQVVDFKRVYQGCDISNVIIYGGATGAKISNSWVSCFNNIYIRGLGQTGIEIHSVSSLEQVNALTIDGIYVQGYENNFIFNGVTGGGRAIYIPHGSSEKSKKTSMIIDGFGGIVFGPGFYFEANYSDASAPGGDELTEANPVNVLIKRTGGVFDAVIGFDKCYFAVADDFDTPTNVVSVAIDSSCPAYVVDVNKPTNVCNTTSYVDYDFYNGSTDAIVTYRKGKSNSNRQYYGNIQKVDVLASDTDVQAGFTSTWDGLTTPIIPTMAGEEYLELEVTATGTTTSTLSIQVVDATDGTTVLQTINLAAGTYTAGEIYRYRLNKQTVIKKLRVPSPAAGDNVSFAGHIFKARIGETGDYIIGPISDYIIGNLV